MTKKTCTPRRKALAMRFKKGGDLHAKRHKESMPRKDKHGYY